LSNFSSVLEIAFAFNALMVIFDLQKNLKRKSKEIQKIGVIELKMTLNSADSSYISNYGWRSLAFASVGLIASLKKVSIFNSTLALFLLIWTGFVQEAQIYTWFMIIILFFLFFPVVFITYLIHYRFKKDKILNLYSAVDSLIEQKKADLNEDELLEMHKDYYSIVKTVEMQNFLFSALSKNKLEDTVDYFKRYVDMCESKKYK
ncbi:MAG: hypothetical protein U9O83_04485, partial [Campylobacterota bacterium]|nr:hypothetical protein [Campylobacterota bacterium]